MIEPAIIRALAEKWLNGTITEQEKEVFENWYNRQPPGSIEWLSADSETQLKTRIFGVVVNKLEAEASEEQVARVIALPNRRRWNWKPAVAAALIFLLGGTALYLVVNNRRKMNEHAGQGVIAQLTKDVKAPATAKATLTLSNGTVIQLDSAGNGSLALQGNTQVMKQANGEITYQQEGTVREMIYNTLAVPRGSDVVTLTLSDGTRVWLNAESSLRYPVAFLTDERMVEITGEAYFEVSKDARRIFKVVANGTTTEVLGTHFNVAAYENQKDIKVTLLEGSVNVSNHNTRQLLTPGQQAGLKASGGITLKSDADLEAVMAWKNGLFKLHNSDIQTIMEQIGRWYNVEIAYEGIQRPINFGGIVSRRSNASVLLDVMALTGTVKFRWEAPQKAGYEGRIVVEM